VRADVDFLRKSPLIADNIDIRGFLYDVETRRVREVT
jgi:carbonic anhydrase